MITRSIVGMLLGIANAIPAASRHAAEGTISDDVWQRIDDVLRAAGSSTLGVDFDDVMGSMTVTTLGTGAGDLALSTSITVSTLDAADYLMVIDSALDDVRRMRGGARSASPAAQLFVEANELEGGYTQITLYEPIFNGLSEVVPRSKGR